MLDVKKIGLLCVHGIGNQNIGEHVAGIARGFYESLKKHYGPDKVSIEYRQGGNVVRIYLRRNPSELVIIELVECYWRDLGEPQGFKRLMRFWWWALTLWATLGFHPKPAHQTGTKKVIAPRERGRLFFYSMVFFILLLPIRMILTILAYIPFVNRIDLFATIYAYMSSVKIYQENPNNHSPNNLLEEIAPRRVWIQKRFANYVFDMANSDYDRWGIFSHSLGSIIAYKGLQYESDHWAWFLDKRRAEDFAIRFLTKRLSPSALTIDTPEKPLWLTPEYNAANIDALFNNFIGVVSYGSPIETFARLWPGLLEGQSNSEYLGRFKWINLYDIRDFISSRIVSADVVRCGNMVNIAVDSHWLIFKAHTEYMRKTGRNMKISAALFNWIIDGDGSAIDQVAKQLNPVRDRVYVASLLFQATLILCIGVVLLPIGVGAFVSLISRGFSSVFLSVFGPGNSFSYILGRASVAIDPFMAIRLTSVDYAGYCLFDIAIFLCLLLLAGLLRRILRLFVRRGRSRVTMP